MLFKIAVAASLALLTESAAIEMELTKVARMSNNAYHSVKSLRNHEIQLIDGAFSAQESYITEMDIGGQIFHVIMDTGSSDLLIVGESCVTYESGTCHPQTPPKGKCSYNGPNRGAFTGVYTGKSSKNCYGTKDSHTFAAFDIYKSYATLAGVHTDNLYVGYITSQSVAMWGSGKDAVDGILGLGYDSNSRIYSNSGKKGTTFMTTMARENNLPNAFSLCFDPSGYNGKMVVGGGELPDMQFTPVIKEYWYTVNMTSISVAGMEVPYALGVEAIVDSGTTEFIVPGDILDAIASELCPFLWVWNIECPKNQKTGHPYVPTFINATMEQLVLLPDITVNIPGVTLTVPAVNYFMPTGIEYSGDVFTWQYGVATNGHWKKPKGKMSIIIGDVVLLSNWVYFDAQNARVGFKHIDNCDQQYIQ